MEIHTAVNDWLLQRGTFLQFGRDAAAALPSNHHEDSHPLYDL